MDTESELAAIVLGALVVSSMLLLTAVLGGAPRAPDETPAETPTETPTATHTASPTPTNSPTPTDHFTTADGSCTTYRPYNSTETAVACP